MAEKKSTKETPEMAAEAAESEQTGNPQAEPEKAGDGATGGVTQESTAVYSAAEFTAAAARVFDRPYSPDIVAGAFRMAGKASATKDEAARIMSTFLKREVRLK